MKRLVGTILMTSFLALGAAACGDDDGGDGTTIDAATTVDGAATVDAKTTVDAKAGDAGGDAGRDAN